MNGLGTLTRLGLRRDRLRIAVAAVLIGLLMGGSASSVRALYPTQAQLDEGARGIAATTAGLAVYGPPANLNTVGGLTLWKPGGLVLVVIALLCAMAVVRHSRADEEMGRAELLGSGAVDRRAPLAAALLASAAQALAVSVVVALAMAATTGPAPHALAGAFGSGLGILVTGLAFAGIAAVTAQVCSTGRAANGSALAVLGAAYLLRAAGDAAAATHARGGWLSDVAPLGWVQLLRPYGAHPRWWAPVLPLLLGLVTALAAAALRQHRDLGSGVFAARPGPARGGARLAGPIGLAWRLQRASVFGWLAGLLVGGALIGAIAGSVSGMIGDSAAVRRMITELGGRQGLSNAYLAATVGIVGLAVAAFAVQSVLRLRGEEEAGRIEPLLAAPVGRVRLAVSHGLIAAAGSVLLALALGLSAGLAGGGRTGSLLVAALAQLPAAWTIAAVAALLVGAAPDRAPLAWGVLAVTALLGQFGAVLRLPGWMQGLSPFAHVPHLPDASVRASSVLPPVLVLTALAAALAVAALVTWRRRDVSSA